MEIKGYEVGVKNATWGCWTPDGRKLATFPEIENELNKLLLELSVKRDTPNIEKEEEEDNWTCVKLENGRKAVYSKLYESHYTNFKELVKVLNDYERDVQRLYDLCFKHEDKWRSLIKDLELFLGENLSL